MIQRWWTELPEPAHPLYADMVLLPFWMFTFFLCTAPFLLGWFVWSGVTDSTPVALAGNVYELVKIVK